MTVAFISHPDCLLHEMGMMHPEQPNRVQAIENELVHTGLIDQLKIFSPPLVEREHLLRVHDKKYVDAIFSISPTQGYVKLDPDTMMNPHTLSAALRAAGAAVMAVDLVMSGECNAVFCNVRPPGHHAEKDKAMGFCFFNNVAVGVAYALAHYHLQRIAIIDFDVHHGNGTEDIFKQDERVLLCSSFQSPFYPNSGENTRSNHILNLPLPAGTAGTTFRQQVESAWFEKIRQFKPDMIFFSAGFDAYIYDDMAALELTAEDYTWITESIKKIALETCHGRMVSMLEGGYELQGLGQCVAAHIRALL